MNELLREYFYSETINILAEREGEMLFGVNKDTLLICSRII
jgi:hypothetical protein